MDGKKWVKECIDKSGREGRGWICHQIPSPPLRTPGWRSCGREVCARVWVEAYALTVKARRASDLLLAPRGCD